MYARSAAGGGTSTAAGRVERYERWRIRAEKCMHELFEEQVERRPEAVAVVYEERAAELRGAESSGPIGWRIICEDGSEAGRGG